jgi:LmbE family N-acetylglucosaminyl deacetylase
VANAAAIRTGADLGTVLGVWAHPDDEAYLSSGLMAQAVDAGSRVVCVTATRGEGGSIDHERWPPASMAEVRTAEMERCLAIVGVTEHVWLDLPDVDWHRPLPDEGRDAVADIMRDVQPDAVLTFGPDGMTNHEGHKSVSSWTTAAFVEHAPRGSSLYYSVLSRTWGERFVPMLRDFGVYRDGAEPPIVDDAELAIDIVLRGELLERKMRALYEHESQLDALIQAFGSDTLAEGFASESFSRAPVDAGQPR